MATHELSQPLKGRGADATPSESKSLEQWNDYYWQFFAGQEKPDVFEQGGLCVSNDGGIKDVKKLLYGMQYFNAFLVIAFSLCNIYMVLTADLRAIIGTAQSEDKFLICKAIANGIAGHELPVLGNHLEKLVPVLELSFLAVLLARIGCFALYGLLSRCRAKRDSAVELRRWSSIVTLFWTDLPQLASLSAMKLLYYVVPTVVGTELYNAVYLAGQQVARVGNVGSLLLAYIRATWPLLSYLVTRTMCLVMGFDAFLIKFRMAIPYFMAKDADYYSVLGAITFLFQLLGLVNLNWFVRERLFIFVFGGENGNLDLFKRARLDVWNCILAKNIYKHHGWLFGTIIMLGFDDYDFQLLVLDVEAQYEKAKRSQAASRPVSRAKDVMPNPGPRGRSAASHGAVAPDQDSATSGLHHRAALEFPEAEEDIFCCCSRPKPHHEGRLAETPRSS